MQRPTRRRAAGAAATTLTACSLFAAATLPAAAMTVTFIRHAESQGNASGYIDTSTPGPHLTNNEINQNGGENGEQQAQDWADGKSATAFDALYASTMIRTQETAAPFADKSGLPVTILGAYDPNRPQQNSGVQEISAGIFEGLPESGGIGRIGYILAPLAWTMGLQFIPVPGGETGLEFNERVTNALTQVEEDTEDTNGDGNIDAAVFSHGATIMMWTMMNVDNPNLLLIVQHPLNNTDEVVVEKNADGSWTLKSWAGEEVGPANYPTQMFVNFRDLIVAPQKAIYNMRIPVLTPDPQGIVTTGVQGVQDVAEAGVKFVKDSITDTVNAITGIPGSVGQPTTQVSTLSTQNTAENVTEDATAATKVAVEKVTEPVRSKVAAVRTAAGATKLTDGNKAEPGKAVSAVRDRVNQAADDVRSGVESSVKQARETVKKLAGADKDDNKTAKPKSASKDAA
ncbi:histidine phosphatase family protein [Mycolicibacterium neworleansense]|uniref:Fructose-2,6-bisphosphatase n=1 Tax=Mycolicibacterium neworleansense TaxID=146018 RepID=A0A0H5SC42_9MYCO|nr:histidine phosphatase family protein [Mycolicibacterium neworleansense]MCV7363697.1 histidine phosphatase family protein [Mycolicibacterium neworleansense]CRZ19049.1 fructose-2,6-bisphosphatase [Mycolicibacterium neworleansense]